MTRTVIRGGTLIDGSGNAPVDHSLIVIEGERIVDILTQEDKVFPKTDNAEIIDASGKTVMPGLIDGHAHMYMDGETSGFFELPIHNNCIDIAMKAIPRLMRTLAMGYTTVRDGGCGYGWFEVSLREAIKRGDIIGPRYSTTGYHLTVTGGHGYFLPPWIGKHAPAEQSGMHCDGPDEWRRAARLNLYNGSDNIKVVASRGFTSQGLRGSAQPDCAQATIEEMRAAIEEAHKMGKKTMAHAVGALAIKNAVLAGVDSIVHGMHPDEEAAQMMADRGVVLEPTNHILRPERYDELIRSGSAVPKTVSREMKSRSLEEFQMIRDKGVVISFGTDVSVSFFPHGDNSKELANYVRYGMTPMEAIVSATSTAATTLGMGKEIGTIEKGKLADILIIDGNPLDNIEVLCDRNKILSVMKSGRIVSTCGTINGDYGSRIWND
jgi:imidazolonepropionase-like amidohydrolase